jgi:sec-independent protein translocase protein TatA
MELFAPAHLLIVLAIALLVFGPRKLPELGKGLGEAIRGFKAGMHNDEETKSLQGEDPKAPPPAADAADTSKRGSAS